MAEINKIAVLANSRTKLSKAKIWNVVKSIIEQSDGQSNESVFNDDLADLYNFFKPVPGKQPKTAEQWISRAMGIKDVRYYLNYIYSDGARLMATDGHRLHLIESNDYAPGYYDTEMQKMDETAKYPEVDKVIPTGVDKKVTKISLLSGELRFIDNRTRKPTEAIKIGNQFFNKSYIDDALSFFDDELKVKQNDRGAIRFTQGNKTAVVMGMRAD